jgi:asparagine synthase (glutamine-hydrolysing)
LLGAYAVVFTDRQSGAVYMATDAFGSVALYYRALPTGLHIATNPICLTILEANAALHRDSQRDVFAIRLMAGARTLWEGVHQVPAGWCIRWRTEHHTEEIPLWRFGFDPVARPIGIGDAAEEVVAALRLRLEELRDSGVDRVAIPLSGGIDSSILAALARQTFPKCEAFTVSFPGFSNPELPRASFVADRLGLRLNVIEVDNKCVAREFPVVLSALQEPPRHFNNVAILAMLRAASGDFGHVLAGDLIAPWGGGIMGKALQLEARMRVIEPIPWTARRVLAPVLEAFSSNRAKAMGRLLRAPLERHIQQTLELERTPEADAFLAVAGLPQGASPGAVRFHFEGGLPAEAMQSIWGLRVLEGSIFRRNDRLSRGLGIQYVYPFESHRLFRLARSLPLALRYDARTRTAKPVLREVCKRLVGEDVTAFPKVGFVSPEWEWIDGPLRDWHIASASTSSPVSSHFDIGRLRSLYGPQNKQTLYTFMGLHGVLSLAAGRRTT